MTSAQDALLKDIALEGLHSSGYAWSLYHKLTGKMLEIELPLKYKHSTKMSTGKDDSQLEVYPNPTNNSFSLNWGTRTIKSVKLFNHLGHLVFEQQANVSKLHISLTNVQQGLYIVEIRGEGSSFETRKIVIE